MLATKEVSIKVKRVAQRIGEVVLDRVHVDKLLLLLLVFPSNISNVSSLHVMITIRGFSHLPSKAPFLVHQFCGAFRCVDSRQAFLVATITSSIINSFHTRILEGIPLSLPFLFCISPMIKKPAGKLKQLPLYT